jgi:hypothetical protein
MSNLPDEQEPEVVTDEKVEDQEYKNHGPAGKPQ